MRQKPVNEKALANMISFLNNIYQQTKDQGQTIQTSYLAKGHNVSSQTVACCKKLGILVMDGKIVKWNKPYAPTKHTALEVLDMLLHKNKKAMHVPLIPELATLISRIERVGDQLYNVAIQNESILKRSKTSNNDLPDTISGTLFSSNQQYHKDLIYLSGQIADGIYKNTTIDGMYSLSDPQKGQIEQINETVLFAAQDLLTKINNLKTNNNG